MSMIMTAMIKRSSSPPGPLRLRIESDPANLAGARQAVESLAAQIGFDDLAAGEIGLVVNEALANVMRHAYSGAKDRPIQIDADAFDGSTGGIRILIRDWGSGVNPAAHPPKKYDPLVPGGLGLVCMRQLMDEMVYA